MSRPKPSAPRSRARSGARRIEFKTVGIDIGSSTSHLLFAKVALQRQSQGLSSRFVVIGREIVWRSPILLTPFLPDGTIDAHALGEFIRRCYRDAGLTQRRDRQRRRHPHRRGDQAQETPAPSTNCSPREAGKFVCATAGHKLECRLAAHGSGAVALSKARDAFILHADIGGGTTKLALIDRGAIVGLSRVRGRRPAGRGRCRRRLDADRSIGAARRRRSRH